ncbi:hypothetical protein JHK85_004426 [Glycine max]|nr:hypothetical protein JHK85_004426 [Glycine max]KAG5080190.1 hypothetical protein JHK86_004255 [Glycine max]
MRPSTLQPQIKLHQGEDAPDTIIIYSISSDPTPLNYAHPTAMTGNQVQEMIGQAMDSFAKQQRQCLEKSALGGVLAPFSIAKMLIARAWSKIWNLLTLKGV